MTEREEIGEANGFFLPRWCSEDWTYIPPKHILKEIGKQKINDLFFFQAVDNKQYRAMAFEKGDTVGRGLLSPHLLLAECSQASSWQRETQASPPGLPEFGRGRWELLKAQAARAGRSTQSRSSRGLHTNHLLNAWRN